MFSSSSSESYSFRDLFPPLLSIRIFRNKFLGSTLGLHQPKFMCLAAMSIFLLIVSSLIKIIVSFAKGYHIELYELSDNFASLSVMIIGLFRAVVLFMHRERLLAMLSHLQRHFLQVGLDETDHIRHEFTATLIRDTYVMRNFYYSCITVFQVIPIMLTLFDWIIQGNPFNYRYPMLVWLPFDDSKLIVSILVHGFQCIATISLSLYLFNEDLCFLSSVRQLRMHILCLSVSLSQLDSKCKSSQKKIKNLIRKQLDLYRLHESIDDLFSLSTFISFSMMKFVLCLGIFILVHGIDAFNSVRLVVGIVGLFLPVYMRCSNGTALHEDSLSLLFSVYDQNWYEGPPSHRRMLITMMVRCNTQMDLHASKFTCISMEYFKEIVLQAYNIFTFLYNFSH